MASIPVKIFEKRGKQWKFDILSDLYTFLNNATRTSSPSFIFAQSGILRQNDQRPAGLHEKLQAFYGMPNEIWSEMHWESNGYFGCSEDLDPDTESQRHSTWFRFLVKQIFNSPKGPFPGAYRYDWYKMGFFTTWNSAGSKSILCLDCPHILEENIQSSLKSTDGILFETNPYVFHQMVVKGLVDLYDKSIWAMRDIVRYLEKVLSEKAPTAEKPDPQYDYLHDVARHVIHSTETLEVSAGILSKIIQHQQGWAALLGIDNQLYSLRVHRSLDFYHGVLIAFRCRSEAMQHRHQNQIALIPTGYIEGCLHHDKAFHTIAQHHSHTAIVDAAAMKIIAGLTVCFLPATFVSAVFSMSFFSMDSGRWTVSEMFWIYWAVSVPLTAITIILLLVGGCLGRSEILGPWLRGHAR